MVLCPAKTAKSKQFSPTLVSNNPAGTIRFSIGYFTSDEDFEALEEALDGIEEYL